MPTSAPASGPALGEAAPAQQPPSALIGIAEVQGCARPAAADGLTGSAGWGMSVWPCVVAYRQGCARLAVAVSHGRQPGSADRAAPASQPPSDLLCFAEVQMRGC
eukprot:scaffold16485_cov14-Tisochrysis_lutea.AAC.1